MFSWPGPDAPITMQSERSGIENKWYALKGRVVELKVEADGDLHIALHDVTGDKPGVVVCEIPAQPQWCEIRTTVFSWDSHTLSFSHWHCEKAELRSISYHYNYWESDVGRRPCTERSKQPSKVHSGLRRLGNSPGNETNRSAISAQAVEHKWHWN